MSHKFPARKYIIILFWIVIWQTVSMAVANELVLVGPWDVARSLLPWCPPQTSGNRSVDPSEGSVWDFSWHSPSECFLEVWPSDSPYSGNFWSR